MKALKIVTIIVFAVFLCGAGSSFGLPRILLWQGLAYRQWLRGTLLIITLIAATLLCALLCILVGKTISQKRKLGPKIASGIVAGLYVILYPAIFQLSFFTLALGTSPEWIEEENGAKYVVVDTSFMMRTTHTQYQYINAFVRSSEGTVILNIKN
jgi:hypothetical protein